MFVFFIGIVEEIRNWGFEPEMKRGSNSLVYFRTKKSGNPTLGPTRRFLLGIIRFQKASSGCPSSAGIWANKSLHNGCRNPHQTVGNPIPRESIWHSSPEKSSMDLGSVTAIPATTTDYSEEILSWNLTEINGNLQVCNKPHISMGLQCKQVYLKELQPPISQKYKGPTFKKMSSAGRMCVPGRP